MAKKKNTSSELASESRLAEKALLVHINISQWSARKIDQKATDTVIKKHNASITAGAYSKRLLPNAPELEVLNAIGSRTRKFFYENTLPWLSDGSRILSTKNYLKFVEGIKKLKAEHSKAVKDFVAAYPALKSKAKSDLGDLYDVDEYPVDIEPKFKIQETYLPLPAVKDFRTEISDTDKKEFEKKIIEVERAAMRECWEKLHNIIKVTTDKLGKPDTIFRDSLIGNVKELVELLPSLNISEDENLESFRKDLENVIDNVDLKEIRKSKEVRSKTNKALSTIESQMSAFMKKNKI